MSAKRFVYILAKGSREAKKAQGQGSRLKALRHFRAVKVPQYSNFNAEVSRPTESSS
jgi:hypothetical protein